MGMKNTIPLGSSGVPAVSLSYDISEGCNDGVCTFHVLSMGLSLALKVG